MDNKGFSLIEILISIVLLGFLLLAVLEAEAISIHNNYSNVYNLYSREILSYELSYAHIWANEGNVDWNSFSPQRISCPGFGNLSSVTISYSNSNCLSVQGIRTALDIGTKGTYNIPLPENMGIFLYITPTSSTQATIQAIVIWAFSQQGVQSNLQLQDKEIFGSKSPNSPYNMITSVSTSNENYLNGRNPLQFNNAISAEDIITRLN